MRPFLLSRAVMFSSTCALVLLALASPALATIKVYNATPPGGSGGDVMLYVVAVCAEISTTPGALKGSATLTDTGGGSVTLDSLAIEQQVTFDVNTTAVFGPGAFFFATQAQTDRPTDAQVGSGSTSPGGDVSWGVLSGWTSTGSSHCLASPTAVCSDNGYLHGATIASQAQSPTYDLGTWSFDTSGDYSAAPYIDKTANGGQSNIQWLLRGSYVGAAVPALPLIGFGALAAALLAGGVRAAISAPEPTSSEANDSKHPN